MKDKDVYGQLCLEARWTFIALFVLIIFWLWAGFGLADSDIVVAGLPLWAVTSSIGVWFFAIALVALLLKFIFRDMTLGSSDRSGSIGSRETRIVRGGERRG